MTKYFYILFAICLLGCQEKKQVKSESKIENLVQYVNPLIGTDGPGNTYPGATVPFGMVQLSPDIGIGGWDRIAGYFYQDSIITGFSHTHLSGTGAGDLYDILVMPTNSRFNKKIKENNYKPFSHFSHENEKAAAGYYQVKLLDFGINAELTATPRVGVHRYTFPKDKESKITVDLGFAMNWDKTTDTHIKIIDNQTIEGFRHSTGWAKNQKVYFVMTFSKPFQKYQLFKKGKEVQSSEITDKDTKIELFFDTSKSEQIIVKTGLSSADTEGAKKAIEQEANHFDFDKYKQQAQQLWQQELQKIQIVESDTDVKTIFYTMLYQSMLAPTLYSDAAGNYKGADHKVHRAEGFNRYDTFSLWDTFRAAHPLYTILHPERVPDFINSLLSHYKETGILPVWSMQGSETNMMIGYHSVPVIVDAYFKGFKFDKELAYEACKKSAMVDDRQIDLYKKYGYVPANKDEGESWSVSKTLEYAYGDWCVAMFAKDLGKKDDYEYFLKRSENWKNIYDRGTSFMRAKDEKGVFVTPFIAKEYTNEYCESNAWHYYWFVPQNIPELIEKTGGKKRFEQKLDSMFTYKPLPTDKLPIFSTGMIGQYAHGNEPSHHVAYLYNYIGKHSKTSNYIYQILKTQYKNEPNGHCGNEDCGQMSSWYVFSSLGFYPVNPAQGVYLLGKPLFEKATIKLPNHKKFEVVTKNNTLQNKYVQNIWLNNKKINRLYITHQEILNGGTLVFEMGEQPKDIDFSEKIFPKPNQMYKPN